jgi:NAD(P)-dependent dehydrogenase (short-subunit alcohol dehydrogenase family)
MDRLAGKIALATGASKGIGAGNAKNLGAEGAITGQLIQAAGGVTL